METICEKCKNRHECKTPCKAVNSLLWEDNRVMERQYSDKIVCYPKTGEVHFAEITDHQVDHFSTDDAIPWAGVDFKLRKTGVFVERFFNKVSCKELAEKYGVKENSIVCMYKQAVEQLEKIIEVMDSRREGIKATRGDRFTEEQKFFLLAAIFGFSQAEVARMFNRNRDTVNQKIKRMIDRYEDLFSGEAPREESPLKDPPIEGRLTRADVVKMVEAYTEQGLSHRQAFMRIADRYKDVVGRPVSFRGIESRYYKATTSEPQGTAIPA